MHIGKKRQRKREEQEKKQFAATGVAVKEMEMEEKWSLSRYALNGLVAFMGAYGTLTCYLSAFLISYHPLLLFGVLLFVSLFIAYLYAFKKFKNIGYILFFIVYVRMLFRYGMAANSGFASMINAFLRYIDRLYQLPSVQLYREMVEDTEYAVTICCIFIGIFMVLLLNIVIIEYMNIGDALIVTFPIVQLGMLFDREPSAISILMVLLSWIMIAVMKFGNHYRRPKANGKRFRMRLKKKQKRIDYLSEAKSNFQIAGAVAAFVLCAALLFMLVLPNTSYAVSDERKALKAKAHSVLREIAIAGPAYFFGEQGTGGLSRGKLGDVARVRFDGKTDLRLRMAPFTVRRMYLKAFSGRDYEGDRWTDDNEEGYTGAADSDAPSEPVPDYRLDLGQDITRQSPMDFSRLEEAAQGTAFRSPEDISRLIQTWKLLLGFDIDRLHMSLRWFSEKGRPAPVFNTYTNFPGSEDFRLYSYLEGLAPAVQKSLSVLYHESHLDGSLGLTAGKMRVTQSHDVNGLCVPYYADARETDELGNPIYTYYSLQSLWDIERDYEKTEEKLKQYYDMIEKEERFPFFSLENSAAEQENAGGMTYTAKYLGKKSYNEDASFGNQGAGEKLVYFPVLLESLQNAELTRRIKERYLDVPDRNKVTVMHFLEEADIHPDDENVIYKVIQYLDENYTYSLNPGRTPRQADYINYFLENNKRGFCAHFASAAVLIFRALGIPARYCEGYAVDYSDVLEGTMVQGEDVKEWLSGTSTIGQSAVMDVNISDENAHAWCEVYMDSFGWVVVDPTPAADEEDDNDFLSSLSGMNGMADNMTDTLGGMAVFTGNLPVMHILLVLFALFLLFVTGRKIYLRAKRIGSYQTEDDRRNVLSYYCYLKNVLAATGCGAEPGMGYREYGARIAGAGYLSEEEAALLMEEIQEKAYGSRNVSPEEAGALLDLMQRAVEAAYRSVSPWRRFLLHVFYCC